MDYELLGELATGGMAKVYLGRRLRADGTFRRVAIKSMRDELVADPEFSAMFVDEANLARRIDHPNVVATYDVVSNSGRLLIVMEYVDGIPLAKLLARGTRGTLLPLGVTARVVTDVLRGLHAAHELTDREGRLLAVVHRDVTPENVMIGVDGRARLFDFGVAKATTHRHVTKRGEIKGKLAYMPPEQQRGERVDRRCDVYAAGAVLWEMLVGRRLFTGSDDEIVQRAFKGTIEPPSMVAEVEIPTALDRVVLRALARKPEERWESAKAMADALSSSIPLATEEEVAKALTEMMGKELTERASLVRTLEERPPPLEAEGRTVREALTRHPKKKRRRRNTKTLVVYAILGVLLGLVLLALFLLSERVRG